MNVPKINLKWTHSTYLCDKPKVSVVSGMKSTKCDIFQAEEVFVIRNSISLLKIRIRYSYENPVSILPRVLTCPPFLFPCPQSLGWKWFFGQILLFGSFFSQPENLSWSICNYFYLIGSADPIVLNKPSSEVKIRLYTNNQLPRYNQHVTSQPIPE